MIKLPNYPSKIDLDLLSSCRPAMFTSPWAVSGPLNTGYLLGPWGNSNPKKHWKTHGQSFSPLAMKHSYGQWPIYLLKCGFHSYKLAEGSCLGNIPPDPDSRKLKYQGYKSLPEGPHTQLGFLGFLKPYNMLSVLNQPASNVWFSPCPSSGLHQCSQRFHCLPRFLQ